MRREVCMRGKYSEKKKEEGVVITWNQDLIIKRESGVYIQIFNVISRKAEATIDNLKRYRFQLWN